MPIKSTVRIEDIGGSWKRFLDQAPRVARAYMYDAVEKTAFSMAGRMRSAAPLGPDAPHIREAITYKRRGQSAQIGILEESGGGAPATAGSLATMADVALYNEYRPNAQPFMRPAAEAENRDFTKRVSDALKALERALSAGGGGVE